MCKTMTAYFLSVVCFVMFFDNSNAQTRGRERFNFRNQQQFTRYNAPEIGSIVKDFERELYSGEKFTLSDHKEKIIVLEFGACT